MAEYGDVWLSRGMGGAWGRWLNRGDEHGKERGQVE